MATDPRRALERALDAAAADWRLGLAGGLVGGVAAGGLLTVIDQNVLAVLLPSADGLTDLPDVVVGWVLHLPHAAVLGVGFAAALARFDLTGASARTQLAAATVYALGTWLALSVLALPTWLTLLDAPDATTIPYLSTTLLAAHVTYGVALGTVYYAFDTPNAP